MKTLFFIFSLSFLFLFSCSSNNEAVSNSNQELIVGIWKPVADSFDSNEVIGRYPFDDCEQRSRYTFFTNGGLEIVEFNHTYDNSGNIYGCLQTYLSTNGSQLRLNENQVKFSFDGDFEIPDRIRFLNNNTFRSEWDNGYYVEYIRVDDSAVNYLIGKWFLNKNIFNNQTQNLTDCAKQANITFNENNTFTREYYFFNGTDCLSEGLDNGTYDYDLENKKITLSYTRNSVSKTEVLNILNLTASSFEYVWDEGNIGVNNSQIEWIK